MAGRDKEKVFAYLRTSSATNTGEGKDSDKRQLLAIQTFARRAGFDVAATYYDADVKGADPVATRPEFAAMLEAIAGNGVRTIVVETASRFSRDLITQETGWAMLKEQGIRLIAADSPDAFLDETPTAKLIRQILGAVSEFEKAMLVAKLKGARDRKRAKHGKCEGRKSHAEMRPDVLMLARKMRRYGVNGRHPSLRAISAKLATAGHLNAKGGPFSASSVANMLRQKLTFAP